MAETCCTVLKIDLPALIDELDDRVSHAYSAMPERLFVVGADGRVAYAGKRGPMGFYTTRAHRLKREDPQGESLEEYLARTLGP